jgi:pSer/pThr/pTyr-binding forkhead associated (FHA) protein
MPWQLRATGGPLEGAVYRLRSRTTLGRASDCDIQIINDGVSRKHAKIVEEGSGHVLCDLSSNNGTYVGELRVERHVLQAGDELRIMRSRFVYESVLVGNDADPPGADVWAVKVTNGRTLRQTVDHQSRPELLELPDPSALPDLPDPSALPDLDGGLPSGTPGARDPGAGLDTPIVSAATSGARPVARILERERHRLTALRPDGSPYRGDLVGDILTFRELQLRVTRRDAITPVELGLLQRFTESFRQPSDDPSPYAGLRRFVRFRCRFPARVRWLEGPVEGSTTVVVQDLGVGGARLTWRDHPLDEGVVAWLVIDVAAGSRSRTLVFPTRVAWVTPHEVGVQFAGVAEWERPPS